MAPENLTRRRQQKILSVIGESLAEASLVSILKSINLGNFILARRFCIFIGREVCSSDIGGWLLEGDRCIGGAVRGMALLTPRPALRPVSQARRLLRFIFWLTNMCCVVSGWTFYTSTPLSVTSSLANIARLAGKTICSRFFHLGNNASWHDVKDTLLLYLL